MTGTDRRLALIRPALPPLDEVRELLEESYFSGIVTLGRLVSELEREFAKAAAVREAVAVSSCTSALMLAWRALALPQGGEVICPSFTFAATAHAIHWNGLVPVFVDCVPGTWTMDPEEAEDALSSSTCAICPVNVFGLPPDLAALEDLSRRKGLPMVVDSAQGLGSSFRGRPSGSFGAAECFSMSPTKVVTAVEGGVLTTDDAELALAVRSLRDYGKAALGELAGEDMTAVGLSARMSELHAAAGLLNLRRRKALLDERARLLAAYREGLAGLEGVSFQEIPADRSTSGNYFVIFIGPRARRSRDEVHHALDVAGIQTKRYFHPPVHAQTAEKGLPMRVAGELPRTWEASRSGLALPLYSGMTPEEQSRVIGAVRALLGGSSASRRRAPKVGPRRGPARKARGERKGPNP